jgi:hypothetical protein
MSDPMENMKRIANEYAAEHDTDFVAYFGDMVRPCDEFLIAACRARKRRKNIILMLATRGGDASVAYRLGRAFQKFYKIEERTTDSVSAEFTVFIPTFCKSAGTVLATAATKIVMSDFAELGPIDAQLKNPQEVGERTSGLTPLQALDSLKRQSKSLFAEHFIQLIFDESLMFSTKMAAEIASGLTVGLLSPMYGQLDPIRLAEVERSLKIAGDYTERLIDNRETSNLKDGAVVKLLGTYPSHGFVIDTMEAKKLFKRVEGPCGKLAEMVESERWIPNWFLGQDKQDRSPYLAYLSDEPTEKEYAKHSGENSKAKRKGEPKFRKDDARQAITSENKTNSPNKE